jgi:hypothetical protein
MRRKRPNLKAVVLAVIISLVSVHGHVALAYDKHRSKRKSYASETD